MRMMLVAVLSAFACGDGNPGQSSTIRVSVQFAGEFDNLVVASDPTGISCPQNSASGAGACTATFPRRTAVRLRAASCTCAFHFEGACSAQDCALDGQSDARVTVVVESFCSKRPEYLLTASTSGRGRITMGNVPIDCGPICSACVSGSPAVLVARPDPGAAFLGWDGPCSGTGDCTFPTQPGIHVSAAFSP